MSELHSENLRLTDFMDVQTLQEIQDSFAAVANVKATITDADGNVLTQPVPTSDFLKRQKALALADEGQPDGPSKDGREFVAPIIVNSQRLGTIRMAANGIAGEPDDPKLAQLKTPAADSQALAKVLDDKTIGSFDEVTPLINQTETRIRRAIRPGNMTFSNAVNSGNK
mgnify:CR=1 FL=1